MIPTRVFYSKIGRAKYISHLDMSRCVARALLRSQLPVWFTEGFNPHVYTTFALPLSLGVESCCESFDMRLLEPLEPEQVCERLNACLPEGIMVQHVAPPLRKPADIAWAHYRLVLFYDNREAASLAERLAAFLAQLEICVEKKTKAGQSLVDIKPSLEVLASDAQPGRLTLTLRLAAGLQHNINPTLFIEAFGAFFGAMPDYQQITRLRITTAEDEDFT